MAGSVRQCQPARRGRRDAARLGPKSQQVVSRRARAARGRLRASAGRSSRADGRERRRQIHADEDPRGDHTAGFRRDSRRRPTAIFARPREAQAVGHRHHPSGTATDEPPDGRAEHLHRPRAAAGFWLVRSTSAPLNATRARCSTSCRLNDRSRARSSARLTVAKQQMVEIAKALSFDSPRRSSWTSRPRRSTTPRSPNFSAIIRELKAPRRRHRLHLAQDGRDQSNLRPRHRSARRPNYVATVRRATTEHRHDHRHDGRPRA